MSPAAVAVVVVVVVLGAACSPPAPDEGGYVEAQLEDRAVKDEFFSSGPACGDTGSLECSPVPLDRRYWMLPLRYYDIDPAYRVPAQLRLEDERPTLEIPTSSGELRLMQRVGQLEFVLRGEPLTLTALVDATTPQVDSLFVPFRDETSRNDTYPAGRYLDLHVTPTGIYDLDFNRAYHPYCYYDETYECPFPPPENRLPVPIQAGEKLPPVEERQISIDVPEDPAP